MINNETIHNFLSQLLIKKWDLTNIESVSSSLKQLNKISLQVYNNHILEITVIDNDDRKSRVTHILLSANMIEIDMILRMFWLKKLNSNIN
jgi:hypothetical protein